MLESRSMVATLSGETFVVAVPSGCPEGGVLSPLYVEPSRGRASWGPEWRWLLCKAYSDDIAILMNG
jgi:hypothetical protein